MITLNLKDIIAGYRTCVIDSQGNPHKHGTFKVIEYNCNNCHQPNYGLIKGLCTSCLKKTTLEDPEYGAALKYYSDPENKVEWYDLTDIQREALIKNFLVSRL